MALQIVTGAGKNETVNGEGVEIKRVLIVDDEENVRNALRRALRKEGYELFFASGPAEGLKILAEQPIDLVMSDHMMPEMSGLEFLTLVRDRHPDVMRLMLTGHADMDTAIKAINQGEIYRFLTKPWDDTELKVTLFLAFERQALERENRRLTAVVRRQEMFIVNLEREYPGIGQVARDSDGAIVLSDSELAGIAQAS
jgi:two-component system, probable response regulator PhcQ